MSSDENGARSAPKNDQARRDGFAALAAIVLSAALIIFLATQVIGW